MVMMKIVELGQLMEKTFQRQKGNNQGHKGFSHFPGNLCQVQCLYKPITRTSLQSDVYLIPGYVLCSSIHT